MSRIELSSSIPSSSSSTGSVPARDWGSLPKDVLPLISKKLYSVHYTRQVRAVCHHFKFSIPNPPRPPNPRLDLPYPFPVEYPSTSFPDEFYVLVESKIYAIEPHNADETTRTWMVKVQESHTDGVQVEHPLSRFLPQPFADDLPNALNLLDFRVVEVDKKYRLQHFSGIEGKILPVSNTEPISFKKVAVTTCYSQDDDKFAILALFNYKLALWRNVDKDWIIIERDPDKFERHDVFVDILYHNQTFYALTMSGIVTRIDAETLTFYKITQPAQFGNKGILHLVGSLNDLLLVVKYQSWFELGTYDGLSFKVYRLDMRRLSWIRMESGLEDRILFLGDDCSYSVSAKEFHGCRGNCIYFHHFKCSSFVITKDVQPSKKISVYDLTEGAVVEGFPEIFSPPPWLEHHSMSVPRDQM
ncbi:hypothetical protein Patl1_29207 [Pistacia atlantica]|uniref:Uncharacterized protein n=1 Tax=Pistacia atlantica TaxID=434234 RepID=A0ACC1BDD7_9ROSI|nr:hypothetical protein Patl1_29207 [Pistacia atlantica]